jgi:ubiquinone biosynthesis protein
LNDEKAIHAPDRPSDLAWGAFSDDAPWAIEPERAAWRRGLDEVRRRTAAEVPDLVRPRRLPPLSRVGRTARLVGAALAGWALGARRTGGAASRADLSRRLRVAFEGLGPSYIKLGQILSAGQGVFPDELVAEFKLCRDRVRPEPFDHVERVVREELGRPIEAVFSEFEREARASASIAQVHAARLASGEAVVVKVQRPRVAERVRQDIRTMAWIAPHLVGRIPVAALANPPALVELFAETILEELDFRLEAENMLDTARVLAASGPSIVLVPRPHPELVTPRLLVMERLDGFAYEDVSAMRAAGVDTHELVRELFIAFLEGAMIFGVFHGDLHGGNLAVRPDGRIALYDHGITARLDEKRRRAFLRLLMTGAVNDVRSQLEAFRDLGALAPDADLDALIRALKIDKPVRDPTKMSTEELGAEVREVTKALLGHGAKLPKPLMLFVKNMLFLDTAIALFAPDVNLFEEMGKIYAWFASTHGARIARDAGLDPRERELDLDGVRASMGLEGEVDAISHSELVARRVEINRKLREGGGIL